MFFLKKLIVWSSILTICLHNPGLLYPFSTVADKVKFWNNNNAVIKEGITTGAYIGACPSPFATKMIKSVFNYK